MNDHNDTAGVVARPPLIYLIGLVTGLLLHALRPTPFLPPRWAKLIGGVMIPLSFVPGGIAVAAMRRAQTNLDPLQPTTAIVTGGSFRYTRNPIYVSFTLLFTGIAAFLNSLTVLVPLPVVLFIMQRGVIEREEAYLERKFSTEYTQYKARVRRWI
jgi:protein-S-isoprenylcysteine O-methyltransferase Ste14